MSNRDSRDSRDNENGPRILVAGGGTSGHIEPAMAVADALVRRHGAHVVALGTHRGLETDVVPERGYELELITPVPIPRKISGAMLKVPGLLARAISQTRRVVDKRDIEAVIGFGGYVSAPAYLAAKRSGIPFFVHEANARAGMANKLGARLGATVLTSAEHCGLEGTLVGIPVRASVVQARAAATDEEEKRRARQFFGLDPVRPVVFVTGGSQGARRLNEAVIAAADRINDRGITILHAYGKKNEVSSTNPNWVTHHFIRRMDLAYAASDLIVCRSGAMTVAEVSAAGLPAVYVPLPHGNGEQALNATAAVDAGAARLITDDQMTGDALVTLVDALFDMSPDGGKKAASRDGDTLAKMRQAALALPSGSAADTIADMIADRVEQCRRGE